MKKQAVPRIRIDPENSNLKQILTNCNGFAKPGEMLAIMGASGSGKTSLLNILGERLDVSAGCKINKEIRANNIPVLKGDFGKLGAFVMQDDILIETMTPYESFCFAARLRTNLPEQRVQAKAQDMINRL